MASPHWGQLSGPQKIRRIRLDGLTAYNNGEDLASCPYVDHSPFGRAWQQGWLHGQRLDHDEKRDGDAMEVAA